MAKPNKDKDRRAVVEQMRKQQQRAEKRRTRTILIAVAVVALVIVALGAYPLIRQSQDAAGDLGPSESPPARRGCQDVVEKSAEGNTDHRGDRHRDPLRRRPAGVRPALPPDRRVRAQVLLALGPSGPRATTSTTSSTATTSSGTTRPSPTTTTRLDAVKGDRLQVRGRRAERQVHRAALDRGGRQAVPRRRPRRADALVRRPGDARGPAGRLAVLRRRQRRGRRAVRRGLPLHRLPRAQRV